MKKLALHWKIMIGMLLGVFWALFSGYMGWNEFTIDWIDPFGVIFINCLKFIAIPLVLFSIVSGVASLGNVKQLGRIGAKTLGLYLPPTICRKQKNSVRNKPSGKHCFGYHKPPENLTSKNTQKTRANLKKHCFFCFEHCYKKKKCVFTVVVCCLVPGRRADRRLYLETCTPGANTR